MENFESQRAALQADLTQAALTGGDTARIRAKLEALNARQQAATEAQAVRDAAARELAQAEARNHGEKLVAEALERLRQRGVHDVPETELRLLQGLGLGIALAEADARNAVDNKTALHARYQQIQERVDALNARADALSALRLSGQATERDVNDAVLIERDIAILRGALADAELAAKSADVPQAIREAVVLAREALHRQERHLIAGDLFQRARAAELELLRLVRELMAVRGVMHASQAYTRTSDLDRWVSYGAL